MAHGALREPPGIHRVFLVHGPPALVVPGEPAAGALAGAADQRAGVAAGCLRGRAVVAPAVPLALPARAAGPMHLFRPSPVSVRRDGAQLPIAVAAVVPRPGPSLDTACSPPSIRLRPGAAVLDGALCVGG